MNPNILGLIVASIYILLILLLAKLFERFGKEASRKFIHIMLSNCWVIAMYYFTSVYYAAILPGSFVIINIISYKTNLIKVMEREDEEYDNNKKNKKSLGTVYYAISLFLLIIITFGPLNDPFIGLCGVFSMGYGDGFAAIIGKSIKSPVYHFNGNSKTIAGSSAMFIITFIIFLLYFYYIGIINMVAKAAISSMIITIIEGISSRGIDNLTVPFSGALLAYAIKRFG